MSTFSLSVADSPDALLGLKLSWERLQRKSSASVFQSWRWCWEWWNQFGDGKRMAVIVARKGSRIVAIFPLFTLRPGRVFPVHVGRIIGTGLIDYGGLLLDKEHCSPEEVSQFFCTAADELPFSFLDLHQLASDEEVNLSLTSALQDVLSVTVLGQESCYRLSLEGVTPELEHLSKKFRSNLRYSRRRLRRTSDVVFHMVSDPVHLDSAMEDFFLLHNSRWRARGMPGSFYSSKRREFHRRLARGLLEDDALVLCFLKVDNVPRAAIYGFMDQKAVYYYQGGFDPDWREHSVASLLLEDLMSWAVSQKLQAFDFLRGNEPYKSRWGATERPCVRLLAYSQRVLPAVAARGFLLENKAVLAAKEVVSKL